MKMDEAGMYLAIVMDPFSRRIVGWHIDKRMTTDLTCKAMIKAVNIRQLAKGVVFHPVLVKKNRTNYFTI